MFSGFTPVFPTSAGLEPGQIWIVDVNGARTPVSATPADQLTITTHNASMPAAGRNSLAVGRLDAGFLMGAHVRSASVQLSIREARIRTFPAGELREKVGSLPRAYVAQLIDIRNHPDQSKCVLSSVLLSADYVYKVEAATSQEAEVALAALKGKLPSEASVSKINSSTWELRVKTVPEKAEVVAWTLVPVEMLPDALPPVTARIGDTRVVPNRSWWVNADATLARDGTLTTRVKTYTLETLAGFSSILKVMIRSADGTILWSGQSPPYGVAAHLPTAKSAREETWVATVGPEVFRNAASIELLPTRK